MEEGKEERQEAEEGKRRVSPEGHPVLAFRMLKLRKPLEAG